MHTYKDFNALGDALGFTPSDLREMDTHTRVTQHACYEAPADEPPVVELSLEAAQRIFDAKQRSQIASLDIDSVVSYEGAPDPIEVMQGLISGDVKFVITDNVVHIRIVRRRGFVAGRTTENVLDTHAVSDGIPASDVVDTMMRLAITNKLDTLPVYIPQHLNPSWLEMTGMVLRPILVHRGGKVQVSLKAVKPAPVVPLSPEKLALQADNIARAVANAPLREAAIVEKKVKQKRMFEHKQLKDAGLLPKPTKKRDDTVFVDIMADGSTDENASFTSDGGSDGGGSGFTTFYNTFLSNFHETPVRYEGARYPSAECAFQAAKCLDPVNRRPFETMTARQAKSAGRKVFLRDDWLEVRVDVMRVVVRSKFSFPPMAAALKRTGSAELIEGNTHGDRFWGVVNGVGKNWLGKILMEIRDELNAVKDA